MTSCLLILNTKPFLNGLNSYKSKGLFWSKFFPFRFDCVERKGKTETDRVASPESGYIHLKHQSSSKHNFSYLINAQTGLPHLTIGEATL